jgi:hypothetical protein
VHDASEQDIGDDGGPNADREACAEVHGAR